MENNQEQPAQPQANSEIEALNKKTSSIDEKLAQIATQIQSMNELNSRSFSAQAPSIQQSQSKPDPVLNPEAYEAYMEQKMEAKMNAKFQAQQQQQSQIASLVNMYPELSDTSSDLTKAALKMYNSLSAEDKASPLAYKIAVQDAALELGLLPKNKRQSNKQMNDSSDIGSQSSSNKQQNNKKQNQKLDDMTLAFAQALGKDINDPKYLERLERAAGRKNWTKSQGKGEY